MTNEQFMQIEKIYYSGGRLTDPEVLSILNHARQLQQKVFCGDMMARTVERCLLDVGPESIPEELQWHFATYVCNEPKTKLSDVEITPGIGSEDGQ